MTADSQFGLLMAGDGGGGSTQHGLEATGGMALDLVDGMYAEVGAFVLLGIMDEMLDAFRVPGNRI
jgi:hypothetical protein